MTVELTDHPDGVLVSVRAQPGARKAGVLGVWYGKAPGVDRAADAFRHGNFVGAHPEGGLIALCGDDPTCKSSTLPSATESALAALGMPVVHPGSVQELLDLGRHAIAASRASGLWVAVKAVSNVVDATGTVNVGPKRGLRDDGADQIAPDLTVRRAREA